MSIKRLKKEISTDAVREMINDAVQTKGKTVRQLAEELGQSIGRINYNCERMLGERALIEDGYVKAGQNNAVKYKATRKVYERTHNLPPSAAADLARNTAFFNPFRQRAGQA